MKNALIYAVIFGAIQVVVSFIVQGVWTLVMGKDTVMNATGLIITMAVFSILTMAVFLLAKWSVVSRHWVRTRPSFVLFWCVVAALGAIVPSVWLQEHMPELPNVVEGEFDMIMKGSAYGDTLDESVSGTWEDKGDGNIELTAQGDAIQGKLNGNELTLSSGGQEMVFSK